MAESIGGQGEEDSCLDWVVREAFQRSWHLAESMKRVGRVLAAEATAGLKACNGKNLGKFWCGCREAGEVRVAQDEGGEKAALMIQNFLERG